jgi:hypothetical protein
MAGRELVLKQKRDPVIYAALIAAAASIFVALISGYVALSVKGGEAYLQNQVQQQNSQINQVAGGTLGTLDQGQKLCVVFHNDPRGIWRDGLIVPLNWKVRHCEDYTKKTGGAGYRLGCISNGGTNLAPPDGSLPSPNCGWE